MDLTGHSDNIDLGKIGEAVGKVTGAVGGLAAGIRNKAKAKKAQKIADAGGYFSLTPFQKSLIPVPAYAQVQAQTTGNIISGNANQPVINDAGQLDIVQAPPLPATDEQIGAKIKAYLPYILGVVALVVLFFMMKKK